MVLSASSRVQGMPRRVADYAQGLFAEARRHKVYDRDAFSFGLTF